MFSFVTTLFSRTAEQARWYMMKMARRSAVTPTLFGAHQPVFFDSLGHSGKCEHSLARVCVFNAQLHLHPTEGGVISDLSPLFKTEETFGMNWETSLFFKHLTSVHQQQHSGFGENNLHWLYITYIHFYEVTVHVIDLQQGWATIFPGGPHVKPRLLLRARQILSCLNL